MYSWAAHTNKIANNLHLLQVKISIVTTMREKL